MYDINVEVKVMLRDKLIDLLEECLAILKEQKDYDFEIFCIDNGKPFEKDKNKTVFHIDLSWSDEDHPGQHNFELIKIIPNDFTAEDRIEAGKSLLKECNKAANDFKEGREYEPTVAEAIRRILKLQGILGGNGGWYI